MNNSEWTFGTKSKDNSCDHQQHFFVFFPLLFWRYLSVQNNEAEPDPSYMKALMNKSTSGLCKLIKPIGIGAYII